MIETRMSSASYLMVVTIEPYQMLHPDFDKTCQTAIFNRYSISLSGGRDFIIYTFWLHT